MSQDKAANLALQYGTGVEPVPELPTDLLDVYYCSPSQYAGRGTWGSGSTRVRRDELGQWVSEQLSSGPILITAILLR